MKEKKKILINRIVWLIFLVIHIFLPIIISACKPKLELLDSQCYTEYDSTTNTTDCEIELTFNIDISSGSAVINFYDNEDNLIDYETAYFIKDDKIVTCELLNIDGEVFTYEVTSLDFNAKLTFADFIYLAYCFFPITLAVFIMTMSLTYKEYRYKDKIIAVYAGFYHHYIKVDGTKLDEYNANMRFTPIVLSSTLDSGEKLQVTISLANKIALKIDDKLYVN